MDFEKKVEAQGHGTFINYTQHLTISMLFEITTLLGKSHEIIMPTLCLKNSCLNMYIGLKSIGFFLVSLA